MDLFYSAKGGVGCSTVAAGVALCSALEVPTLLVDCGGDLDLLLGLRCSGDPVDMGLCDWMVATDPPPDALARLEVFAGNGLSLLPAGLAPWHADPARIELLATLLERDGRRVIVDAGTRDRGSLLASASQTVLVSRSCYLSLSSSRFAPRPDTLVVVKERGRAYSLGFVEQFVPADRTVMVPWDTRVGPAIDSGQAVVRLPKLLGELKEVV